MKIRKDGKKVLVSSPYHPNFPAAARKIGGKWVSGTKEWQFDMRDEARVRTLCIRIFGTDGSPAGGDVVDVRVSLYPDRISSAEIWALGREIIARKGRDSEVAMGEGVILAAGEFALSGGSRNNPEIASNHGRDKDAIAMLEVRDVPRALVTDFVDKYLTITEIIEHETSERDESERVDELASISDDKLIAALTTRGYIISKAS